MQLGLRRARVELVAARAADVGEHVLGVDVGLHRPLMLAAARGARDRTSAPTSAHARLPVGDGNSRSHDSTGGFEHGEGSLRALRRSGRRISAGLRARRDPEDRALPRRADHARPRSGIDFTPGELLGSVSGELGLRKFLEDARPHADRHLRQGRPRLGLRARAARRRGRHLAALLARLPDRRADRQGAEAEAGDHGRHRLRPRRPAGGDRDSGITVAEVTYSQQHQRLRARGDDDPRAGAQLHPLLPGGGRRRLEHRRLRLALLRPRGDAGRHGRRRAHRLGGAAAPEAVRGRPALHRSPPPAGRRSRRSSASPSTRRSSRWSRSATWSRSTRRCTPRPRTCSTTS